MSAKEQDRTPEELFIQIFSDAYGPEKTRYLFPRCPFDDIRQIPRVADFVLQLDAGRVAIEIEESRGQQDLTGRLLAENSMTSMGWSVYRWSASQLRQRSGEVQEELQYFLGEHPRFQEIADFLPAQRGSSIDARSLELRDHQRAALDALAEMRRNNETIALLYHATGTGKTVTAILDAMQVGPRVLYLAHTKELVEQTADRFSTLWPERTAGRFTGDIQQTDTDIVCATVQSMARNLNRFSREAFRYLIVDEAHHAAAETCRKVLAYFHPQFTLGLTATPERADGRDILDIFRHTAHRLDIQTAVELGELSPVRCIRVRTSVDLSDVRIRNVQYVAGDLERKVSSPARDRLIVDTWFELARGRLTLVFCVSVSHAKRLAQMFRDRGAAAEAVYGTMKQADRESFRSRFRSRELTVLCACDLLSEGWDCPETEVLFMARPTLSQVVYTQQLGRGMRKAPGKDFLMVVDFVDNAGRFSTPWSLHRLLGLKDYRPGQYAAAPAALAAAEARLYEQGIKPEALQDWPLQVTDYELVDLFSWQREAEGMLSQKELVRRVMPQAETVEQYIASGKLRADLEIPTSSGVLRYFKESTLLEKAAEFGWEIIDDSSRKEKFVDMVRTGPMSKSYKPVLITAFFRCADGDGRAQMRDIIASFRSYYENRLSAGLVTETQGIFRSSSFTDAEIRRLILDYPYRRFADRGMMHYIGVLDIIQMDEAVWTRLTEGEKEDLVQVCSRRLEEYFRRLKR